jgi:hypothetical protein
MMLDYAISDTAIFAITMPDGYYAPLSPAAAAVTFTLSLMPLFCLLRFSLLWRLIFSMPLITPLLADSATLMDTVTRHYCHCRLQAAII